jgi:chromate transporter
MTEWPELFRAFGRIGVLSFGGPAAQIALMHRELVDKRKWVSEDDYLTALSFCMLLPGPEAMQLATWIGWRLRGVPGGLLAGLLFVLPGAAVVLVLSVLYAMLGQVPLVAALFTGVQAAVVAVVVEALLRVSKRALKTRAHWVVAGLAFAALFVFGLPFPVVILAAGLYGFLTTPPRGPGEVPAPAQGALRDSLRATVISGAIWGAIWLVPLAVVMATAPSLYADIAVFFSKLAVVTFGGAYAVLAWMAQAVVAEKHWLSLPQMMDGLGLAETTPGPLILVTEFVGFQAGYGRDGLAGGLAGAALTLWMTFAPCFLWIFAGSPWIARLTHAPRLSGALKAITAAVVGVIANLSLWFALHVVFARVAVLELGPLHLTWADPTSLRALPTLIGLAAAWALLRRHWPLLPVLAAAAVVSAVLEGLI